jgi:hypothetical protein
LVRGQVFKELDDLCLAEVGWSGVEFSAEFRGTETDAASVYRCLNKVFLGYNGVVGEDCESTDDYFDSLQCGS